jgi:hypothetical protein
MEDIKSSILEMAKGAIQERVDYEVTKVIDNILDINTNPTEKRKVVLTIEMKPDEQRQVITMKATAKSTLAPTTPIASSLVVTSDENGKPLVAEIVPQVPGQISMDGVTQEKPKLLKLAAN